MHATQTKESRIYVFRRLVKKKKQKLGVTSILEYQLSVIA